MTIPDASFPSVMLSPNATNRVGTTVTPNSHEDVCCKASVPTHVTCDVPIPNAEPLAGMHRTLTGAVPPVTLGSAKVTLAAAAVIAGATVAAGHVKANLPVGGEGPIGLLPHRAVRNAPNTTGRRARYRGGGVRSTMKRHGSITRMAAGSGP